MLKMGLTYAIVLNGMSVLNDPGQNIINLGLRSASGGIPRINWDVNDSLWGRRYICLFLSGQYRPQDVFKPQLS